MISDEDNFSIVDDKKVDNIKPVLGSINNKSVFTRMLESSAESVGHASVDVEDEFEELISSGPVLDLHRIHGVGDVAFVEPAAVDVVDSISESIVAKPVLNNDILKEYKHEISPAALSSPGTISPNGLLSSIIMPSQVASILQISKAAARMRKYRYDHRNDVEWLNKESVRKRAMRAKRKREAGGGAIVEHVASAVKSKTEVDLVEYNRKEAERARKYRAAKRLDPVWKERDAARMRVWRAKRKADSGSKIEHLTLEEEIYVRGNHTSSSLVTPPTEPNDI
jgi:hypothetical protein